MDRRTFACEFETEPTTVAFGSSRFVVVKPFNGRAVTREHVVCFLQDRHREYQLLLSDIEPTFLRVKTWSYNSLWKSLSFKIFIISIHINTVSEIKLIETNNGYSKEKYTQCHKGG